MLKTATLCLEQQGELTKQQDPLAARHPLQEIPQEKNK